MGKGIGRLRTMGIAAQPTFGQAAPTATYVLPLTNSPQFTPQVAKALNDAALGSAYSINALETTVRFTEVPLEFKVDEDQYPLLLKQRFTIVSGTTTGEDVVYGHTATYANGTQSWYTLFLQDDNLENYIVKDALFDNLDHTFDNDFIRITASVVGAYPTQSSVTNAITQPKEFVGRMVTYKDADSPSTPASVDVLALTANLDFGLNSEDTRHGIGSADLAALELTSDKFMFNVSKVKDDVSYYDDNEGGTLKELEILIEDTGRFISPSSSNPSILYTIPRAKIENYTEEPDLDDLIKENFDLTLLKPAGVSKTPMEVVIQNSVESY